MNESMSYDYLTKPEREGTRVGGGGSHFFFKASIFFLVLPAERGRGSEEEEDPFFKASSRSLSKAAS
jgi:hypothetical protein